MLADINVVPANAGTHTPRTINVRSQPNPDEVPAPVVMGPRVRGDDALDVFSPNPSNPP